MAMETVLREKRKALGLTQEQVANRLGVSAPAVNKWERGVTCPDLLLLPALARLLKTDPNTLLGFQDTLTKAEIAEILQGLIDTLRADGVAQGFTAAEAKLREYPYCAELQQSAATVLSGALITAALPEADKEPYREKINTIYRRVAAGGDTALANQAKYMLASAMIHEENYDEAQALLDDLPDWSALDKRGMQADVLDRQGDTAKAAQLLERKLVWSLQDQQTTLCRLIRLSAREGNETGVLALAACAKAECEAFRLGDYWESIAPLEAALALQNAPAAVEALGTLLREAAKPWNPAFSPLFYHLPAGKAAHPLALQMLAPILSSVQDDPKYAFLADNPAFQELVTYYAARAADPGRAAAD